SDLADGIGEVVDVVGMWILGGNVAASDVLCLTITVLGDAFALIGRGGLHFGDRLYVTGRFGGPGAPLVAWVNGAQPPRKQRERFARRVARLGEARWLCDRGAVAAIDISDGLAADLGHLTAASGVGADIDLALLPLAAGVSDAVQAAASGE